jgi:hypothetical protein
MGSPDTAGNFFKIVGPKAPRVMFTAHYDTVHSQGGQQIVTTAHGMAYLPAKSTSECLGADDTVGVWLVLEMIEAGVPGAYAVFADEEIGCVGSSWFAENRRNEIESVEAVISLDRKGIDSIVTHQSGRRTASEEFAASLESILRMGMKPDSGGSFTDSNEFASFIPEATNISVGYFSQHTQKESLDLFFAADLRDALVCADWSKLVIHRDPKSAKGYDWMDFCDYAPYGGYGKSYSDFDRPSRGDYESLRRIVRDHPDAVASLLADCGYSYFDVLDYVDAGSADIF